MSQAAGGCWVVRPFLSILLPLSWRFSLLSNVRYWWLSAYCQNILSPFLHKYVSDTVETLTWSCLPSLYAAWQLSLLPSSSCHALTSALQMCLLFQAFYMHTFSVCLSILCGNWVFAFFFLHWGPALGTLCPMSFLRVKNKKQALCLQSNYAI